MIDETEAVPYAQRVRADTAVRLRRAKTIGPMAGYYGDVIDALDALLDLAGYPSKPRKFWSMFIKCDGIATMTDERIAAEMNVSVGTVRRKRVAENCEPFGSKKAYTDEDIRRAWQLTRTIGGVARHLKCSKRTASVRVRALGLGEVTDAV